MIVNKKYEFVYIGIIKSGSETLHKYFKAIPGSLNPLHNREYRHHERIAPKYARDYEHIVSIRNPYNRLASLYAMAHHRNMIIPHNSFEEMVDFLIESLNPEYARDYVRFRCLPIHKYLEPVKNVRHIIKLENIKEDVERLPYEFNKPLKLPHINKQRPYKSFEELATPGIIEKVNYWAGEDFELYGYKRL